MDSESKLSALRKREQVLRPWGRRPFAVLINTKEAGVTVVERAEGEPERRSGVKLIRLDFILSEWGATGQLRAQK